MNRFCGAHAFAAEAEADTNELAVARPTTTEDLEVFPSPSILDAPHSRCARLDATLDREPAEVLREDAADVERSPIELVGTVRRRSWRGEEDLSGADDRLFREEKRRAVGFDFGARCFRLRLLLSVREPRLE